MSWVTVAVSVVSTAVSTGISFFSQQQQAKNATAIANYNYAIQKRNADINARMAQQQALWNQQSAMAQYQAQQNNALALEQQGRAAEAQGREQARRMRDENEQMLARQRALYGNSGVVSEGTPLTVMGNTAARLERNVQDVHYQSDLQGREYDRKAENERFQSGFSVMDAQIAEYQGAAASIGRRMEMNQAEINRMSGLSQAQGYRMGSYATLISGVGSMVSSGMSMYSAGLQNQVSKAQLKQMSGTPQ